MIETNKRYDVSQITTENIIELINIAQKSNIRYLIIWRKNRPYPFVLRNYYTEKENLTGTFCSIESTKYKSELRTFGVEHIKWICFSLHYNSIFKTDIIEEFNQIRSTLISIIDNKSKAIAVYINRNSQKNILYIDEPTFSSYSNSFDILSDNKFISYRFDGVLAIREIKSQKEIEQEFPFCDIKELLVKINNVKQERIRKKQKELYQAIRFQKTNHTDSCRYYLGTEGVKPLIIIGLNPSIADNIKLDKTVSKIIGYIARNDNFDSFIMINLYPQRATHIHNMDKVINTQKHKENIFHISQIINKVELPVILGAWSERIVERKYLFSCLESIYDITKELNIKWLKIGELTKSGHPRHPSRTSYNQSFTEFNIIDYISNFKK